MSLGHITCVCCCLPDRVAPVDPEHLWGGKDLFLCGLVDTVGPGLLDRVCHTVQGVQAVGRPDSCAWGRMVVYTNYLSSHVLPSPWNCSLPYWL